MAGGMNVGSIYYEVEADTSKLVNSSTNVDSALDKMNKRFGQTDKAANQAQFQMTQTAAAVKGLGREASVSSSALKGFSGVLAGLISLQGVSSLIQMAEAYNEMAERVQMATSNTAEFNMVQTRLLDTANKTYRSLSEAQEVFVRTSASLKAMGYETESALDVTDSLSYSFVKNATSVDRARGATDAFSKVLNKGKVEADAWETILAAIPTVIDDVAAASGRSAQEIRQMGVSGELTARMLTEGLRKSLDDNKAAADGMATTVKDAFTALRNNLSAIVGEANKSSGATQLLSKAMLGLAKNLQTVITGLTILGAGALAKLLANMTASTIESAKASLAARAQATAALAAAVANERAAAAAAGHAAAQVRLGGSLAASTAAANAHRVAQTALAGAQRAATAAGTGMLALLGGPAGLIGLVASVATGVLLFGDNAKRAAPNVEELATAVDNLTQAQLELRRIQVGDAIEQIEKEARDSSRMVSSLTKDIIDLKKAQGQGVNISDDDLGNANKSLVEQKANLDEVNTRLQKLYELQDKLANQKPRERTSGGGAPAAPEADPEVAKRLQGMREELSLSKLQGAERAKLAAVQRLGANATKLEREEAEKLAEAIYRNSEANKSVTDSTKASVEARKKDRDVLVDLAQDLQLAALSGEALAAAKAKNQLSGFATPQQIADLERMAKALYALDQQNRERQKFGSKPKDSDQYIMGDVSPLSGGAFDDQIARYEAEAKAEEQRYAEQQERLVTARELKIETQKSYDQLEEEAAIQHADRMAQIDRARSQIMLAYGEDGFAALAEIMKNAAGEQSAAYKTMFAASKAFAIADGAIQIANGIAKAANNPWPVNLAAMASVAAAGAGVIASISSISMGSGRQYGGAVDAGTMHRINENGQPEILNTASGRQYLLPNSRGEVISNKDAKSGSGAANVNLAVNLIEDQGRAGQVETRQDESGIQVNAFVADIRGGGPMSRTLEQTYAMRRVGS